MQITPVQGYYFVLYNLPVIGQPGAGNSGLIPIYPQNVHQLQPKHTERFNSILET